MHVDGTKKMRAYDVEKNIRHLIKNTRHIF